MNLKNCLMVGAIALGMSCALFVANLPEEESVASSLSRKCLVSEDRVDFSIELRLPNGNTYKDPNGNVLTTSEAAIALTSSGGDIILSQNGGNDEFYGHYEDAEWDSAEHNYFIWHGIWENQDPALFENASITFGNWGGDEGSICFTMPYSYINYEYVVAEGSSYVPINEYEIANVVTYATTPINSPNGVVGDIVSILTGGLISLGSGLGTGINGFIQSLAFSGGDLSIYFVLICVFGGIALAVGLTTKIFNWLQNIGA